MADVFGDLLSQVGYRVQSNAAAVLEGEIREFWVRADGWTEGASERVRVRLRDKGGNVVWEQAFRGEDGGMDMVDSFAEKSMNVALTRLLTDAGEECASVSFYEAVRRASGNY